MYRFNYIHNGFENLFIRYKRSGENGILYMSKSDTANHVHTTAPNITSCPIPRLSIRAQHRSVKISAPQMLDISTTYNEAHRRPVIILQISTPRPMQNESQDRAHYEMKDPGCFQKH